MKRKIIHIDDEKCNGCGLCIPGCPEGALQIIEGKARLISDLFCDGLGACIGECPEGAILIEEREAEPYDERRVMENIIQHGDAVIKAHLDHLKDHNETDLLEQAMAVLKEKNISIPIESETSASPLKEETGFTGGCPGAAVRSLERKETKSGSDPVQVESHLSNWPVQLQLLNPHAPYLKNADLLVCADCVPFAYANFHQRFLKGKVMVTFCPKLDQTIEQYNEKLAVIFRDNQINSVSVVQMEVPCCGGTSIVVQRALEKAKKILPIKEYTISISGNIL